jgi:hypothetical protein
VDRLCLATYDLFCLERYTQMRYHIFAENNVFHFLESLEDYLSLLKKLELFWGNLKSQNFEPKSVAAVAREIISAREQTDALFSFFLKEDAFGFAYLRPFIVEAYINFLKTGFHFSTFAYFLLFLFLLFIFLLLFIAFNFSK